MELISNLKGKDLVNHIKAGYENSDREFAQESLSGAINRIQKAFPRYGSFLMEFIQNADDANSHTLQVEIQDKGIKILNDGEIFKEKDVMSICKVGKSSKTPRDYIGYLGVGFKAVFLISDKPRIHSGSYYFEFNKNKCTDPKNTPWQVIPIWIDLEPENSSGFSTEFELPVKDDAILARIQKEMKEDQLNPRMMLFFRNVNKIILKNKMQNSERTIERTTVKKYGDISIVRVKSITDQENDTRVEFWLLFRRSCQVPQDVKEDHTTIEWERESVEKREVMVAFRLDSKSELISEEKGTAHTGVFSFLPLKEVPSGLNFLIQADFLTTPGRSEFARESLWNEWLTKEIYQLVVDKCVPEFLSKNVWKYDFIRTLYGSEGGHELFEEHLKKPLRNYLDSAAVLISEDGSRIKPSKALLIGGDVRRLLSLKDISKMFPRKKILSKNSRSLDLLNITRGPLSVFEFIQTDSAEEIIESKAKRKEYKWFERVYLALSKGDEDNITSLRNSRFILTSELELVSPDKIYLNNKKILIPPSIQKNFKLVNQYFLTNTSILRFFSKLGIKKLRESHVKDILQEKELPALSRDWGSYSEKEKLKKLEIVRDLFNEGKVSNKDLAFITLRTKSGRWLDPNQIIFSKEYNPNHNLESLSQRGLFDLKVDFLDPRYSNRHDKSEWMEFFSGVGVDSLLERNAKHISQRIGIRVSLEYEKRKGRKAKELGESEKPGYDVESKDQGRQRFIEVKGRKDRTPNIFVTSAEYQRLQKDASKYFLYVVTDAFTAPRLYCISGSKILSSTNFSVSFDYKLWKSLMEDEYAP